MRRRPRLLTLALLATTFTLGAVTGMGITHCDARRLLEHIGLHRPHPSEGLPHPYDHLELAPAQLQRAQAISARYRPELEAVVRESFPRMRALNERMAGELRAVLTPEQQQRLDALERERRRHRQAHRQAWPRELRWESKGAEEGSEGAASRPATTQPASPLP